MTVQHREGGSKLSSGKDMSWFKTFYRTKDFKKVSKGDKTRRGRRKTREKILMIKENHIPRNAQALGNGIIPQGPFLSGSITHEGTLHRLSTQFVTLQRWQVKKAYTSKSVKDVITRLYVIETNKKRIKVQNLRWKAVDQVYNSGQSFN